MTTSSFLTIHREARCSWSVSHLNLHNLHVINGKVRLTRRIHLDQERANIPPSKCSFHLLPRLRGVCPDHHGGVYGVCEPELAAVSSDVGRELVVKALGQGRLLADISVYMIS